MEADGVSSKIISITPSASSAMQITFTIQTGGGEPHSGEQSMLFYQSATPVGKSC